MTDETWSRFKRWRTETGERLERHALFEALGEIYGLDRACWPPRARHGGDIDVPALFAAHADAVTRHAFRQWLAFASLEAAQTRAKAAGMAGLIADLAVGASPDGSEAWSDPGAMLAGMSIGAPPDLLAPEGQCWGLTTYTPTALAENDYARFRALLRTALATAAGVRIDHVLGLRRLWLVPDGESPKDGVYLRYPEADLLAVAAEEAAAAGALLIGEDLGTVPEGFRDALAARCVHGMRVLLFERDDTRFTPSSAWDACAVAMTTTHDTPTLAGWRMGRDLEWRERLRFASPEATVAAMAEREEDPSATSTTASRSARRTTKKFSAWTIPPPPLTH